MDADPVPVGAGESVGVRVGVGVLTVVSVGSGVSVGSMVGVIVPVGTGSVGVVEEAPIVMAAGSVDESTFSLA